MSDNRAAATAPTETPAATTDQGSTESDPSLLGIQPEPVPGEAAPEPFSVEALTLPEGFEKTEAFERFTTLAGEHKLSKDTAQALFDLYHEDVKGQLDKVYSYWPEQNKKWIAEVQSDPELGGDKLPEVKQTVARVLDNADLSDPGFRAALDISGMGSNPAVVRTLYRWAQRLTEGGAVGGDAPARNRDGSLSTERPAPAQSLYGREGPFTGGPKLNGA